MQRLLNSCKTLRTLRFSYRSIMSSSKQQAPSKRQKLEQVIGTHNGTFHCDEALAVFLLRQTAAYREATLKRTRDPAILDTCDIVVDVGAVYDAAKKRFDHHQRGFTEVFGHGFETKLSSAGLIYKHFGQEVIANTTKLPVDDQKVETLWLKMYKEFIEAIDAIDNGISQYPSDIKPKYRSRTDLSSRVGTLNPAWNQPTDSQTVDSQFAKASLLAGEEFLGKLDYYANAWLPARDILIASVASSKQNIDPSGKIILFEQFLPWKEHLFELEADPSSNITPGEAIYVVYPDETAGNWRVQAVPASPESFESRKALPEQWRGLRDEELSTVSGIPGGIFIHASGFIGGNKTKDGALQIARAAMVIFLPQPKPKQEPPFNLSLRWRRKPRMDRSDAPDRRPQRPTSFVKAHYHPFLFAMMTCSALAELGLTAFLISAGNENRTWPSPRYHSLLVEEDFLPPKLLLTTLILFLFNAVWTTLFSTAYMLWIVGGSSHLLASIASSVIWLVVTTVLWASTCSCGTAAGVMHNTRSGGNCAGRATISRSEIYAVDEDVLADPFGIDVGNR
ncbi:hypothetical protein Hypma_015495, partial [Hypsizygus marmoreus]